MAKNYGIDRRSFVSGAFLTLAGALLPVRSVAGTDSPWVGRIALKSGGNLRILAFTDLHFGFVGSKISKVDERSVHDMQKMNDLHQPDLIIVTGDAWHDNPAGKGVQFCRYFCQVMSDLGRPWAFVRGNHDKADDFAVCEKMFAATPGCLYLGAGTNGNYRLKVAAGELTSWNLIFINDSIPKMGFGLSQINWLKNEAGRIRKESAKVPPCLLFCHIPILAYREMFKAGKAKGMSHEKVNCSSCHSGSMDAIGKTGQIKAMFCGHDHVNDYEGDWQGVHLEYLRATGYGGYGQARLIKGGKVIDLRHDGTLITKTVFASGFEWNPNHPVK